MKAVIFVADQAGALALQSKLDASIGCPIVGRPINWPGWDPSIGVTTHYGSVIQHPTVKANFATQVDGFDSSKLQAADKTAVDAAKVAPDLTADWFA